ncbi:hypothetical protein ES705_23054 [subsurface metagenome]
MRQTTRPNVYKLKVAQHLVLVCVAAQAFILIRLC